MSSDKNRVIQGIKSNGVLPGYIYLAHRLLEKNQPAPLKHLGLPSSTSYLETFLVPVDVLRTCKIPEELVEEFESIELTFRGIK